MNRFICIHGHFYQPSRENPWLNFIALQEDAYPYHDWNEKINAECYMVNSGSHILNSEKKIIKVINNYSRISFNFGPLLLSWIKQNDPNTYKKIMQADIQSRQKFNGHGSALAQIYNHIIMPLADRNDKYIQVIWAVKDFEANFKRKPEGMWLSETAVDYETLEILSDLGIKFTILSPDQALKIRRLPKKDELQDNSPGNLTGNPSVNLDLAWTDVSDGSINTRMPYLCRLAGGRSINIFFYDRRISNRTSFGNLLEDGRLFVQEIINAPSYKQEIPEIICIATDGETYGHHHKFGDMALAYALDSLESGSPVELTVFGSYLERFKPVYEVQIKESSSWSCSHGICRWKENCGCTTGSENHFDWNQQWRIPLRQAIDWLSSKARTVYENEIKKYAGIKDSNLWEIIQNYISILNDPSEDNIITFLHPYAVNAGINKDFRKSAATVLKILEMYRNAMLMQSSDGWFFDDISRTETIQIMRHACRAMEIIKELTLEDNKQDFTFILKDAKSNVTGFVDGKYIYENYAKTASYDFEKITAHFVFEILLDRQQHDLFSYKTDILNIEKIFFAGNIVITGIMKISSKITLEAKTVFFASYLFKGRNILNDEGAAVFTDLKETSPLSFKKLARKIKNLSGSRFAPQQKKESEILKLLPLYVSGHKFILKDLLKDKQVELSEEHIFNETEKINPVIFRLYNDYENTVKEFGEKRILNYFLDGIFPGIQKFIGEMILFYAFRKKGLSQYDLDTIKNFLDKIAPCRLINITAFNYLAAKKIDDAINLFCKDTENTGLLKMITDFFILLEKAALVPNTWKAQNRIFEIKETRNLELKKKNGKNLQDWAMYFEILLEKLSIDNSGIRERKPE